MEHPGAGAHVVVVVSLAPQAVASIATACNISAPEAQGKIAVFLRGLGVARVFSTAFSARRAVREAGEEFCERWAAGGTRGKMVLTGAPCKQPVLASESSPFPGFVIYVEKTHGKELLPLLAKVKSPMAVSGTLIKDTLAPVLLAAADPSRAQAGGWGD
ncbi:iron hydrogenase, partial [Baffinella frigidus]